MKISSYMNNMNPIIEKNDAKVQKENKQANERGNTCLKIDAKLLLYPVHVAQP